MPAICSIVSDSLEVQKSKNAPDSPGHLVLCLIDFASATRIKPPLPGIRTKGSRIVTTMQISGISAIKLFFLTCLLGLCGIATTQGNSVTVRRGQDPAGQHVVLVVPAPSHEAVIGTARQIATLPLQSGVLTVIEAKSTPNHDQLGEFLAETLSAEAPPDWVWVHERNFVSIRWTHGV
jgi:hypothetical protein